MSVDNAGQDSFDAVDHAILSRWLGIEPPPQARGVDVERHLYARTERRQDFRIDDDDTPPERDFDEFSIANAVARIVLAPIAGQVQEVVPYEGRRDIVPAQGAAATAPELLFAVRWPGQALSLQAYVLGRLPGYGRHVLVSCWNASVALGYADQAVGAFPVSRDPVAAAGELLFRGWREGARTGETEPWEEVWAEGAVKRERALAWAARAWPPELVEAIARDPRPTSHFAALGSAAEPLGAATEITSRATEAQPVAHLHGIEGYTVHRGTARLIGTEYIEIRRGRNDNSYWAESSVYVHADEFPLAAGILRRHLPSFDFYSMANHLPRALGTRVVADWAAAAEGLADASPEAACRQLSVSERCAAELASRGARIAVAQMLRDLADACGEIYTEGEWICLVGL